MRFAHDPLRPMLQLENPALPAQLFLHFMACSSELGLPEEFAV